MPRKKGAKSVMPRKKKVDSKELIKLVSNGIDQKEIMDKLGYKTSTQLKVAYANALMESGQAPTIIGTRGSAKPKEIKREVSVNKRGSLVIPKTLAEDLGLVENDTFFVKASKIGLSLKRVYTGGK